MYKVSFIRTIETESGVLNYLEEFEGLRLQEAQAIQQVLKSQGNAVRIWQGDTLVY